MSKASASPLVTIDRVLYVVGIISSVGALGNTSSNYIDWHQAFTEIWHRYQMLVHPVLDWLFSWISLDLSKLAKDTLVLAGLVGFSLVRALQYGSRAKVVAYGLAIGIVVVLALASSDVNATFYIWSVIVVYFVLWVVLCTVAAGRVVTHGDLNYMRGLIFFSATPFLFGALLLLNAYLTGSFWGA